MRSSHLCLVLASTVAACGGGGHDPLDGGADAATPDTMIDAPTSVAGCDYSEQHDTTNDDTAPTPGTPEQTGIVLASRAVICGAFDHTHFDGDITVDVDGYKVALAADADVLIRISGAGAEAIELVGVDVYGGPSLDQHLGAVTFYGDHGVTALHLAAGTYELLPFALAEQAITASVPYKLEVSTDMPATRCAELTSGGYTEAGDGTGNTGNDVVQFPSGSPTALTAATTDVPEPTNLSIAPGARARLTGSAADVAVADRYEDKDTFAIATAAGTNEMTVRLAWTGAADLDFYLFEAGNPDPVLRALATTATTETQTFSIKAGASYWLLVGAKAGGTGLPAGYAATLCGAAFTP